MYAFHACRRFASSTVASRVAIHAAIRRAYIFGRNRLQWARSSVSLRLPGTQPCSRSFAASRFTLRITCGSISSVISRLPRQLSGRQGPGGSLAHFQRMHSGLQRLHTPIEAICLLEGRHATRGQHEQNTSA
jgi:hypothetical protein